MSIKAECVVADAPSRTLVCLRPSAMCLCTSSVTRWHPLPRELSVKVFCQGILYAKGDSAGCWF